MQPPGFPPVMAVARVSMVRRAAPIETPAAGANLDRDERGEAAIADDKAEEENVGHGP